MPPPLSCPTTTAAASLQELLSQVECHLPAFSPLPPPPLLLPPTCNGFCLLPALRCRLRQPQGDSNGQAPVPSEGEGGGRLSLADPLASANLLTRLGSGPSSAAQEAQGQPPGAPPADAAAMLQAQRRVLLALRQKVAAAAAQQQLLQQQAQQQDAREHPEQQLQQLQAEAGALHQQQRSLPLPQAAQQQLDLQQRQHSLSQSLGQQLSLGQRQPSLGRLQRQPSAVHAAMQAVAQAAASSQHAQQPAPPDDIGPVLEVDSDFLEKEVGSLLCSPCLASTLPPVTAVLTEPGTLPSDPAACLLLCNGLLFMPCVACCALPSSAPALLPALPCTPCLCRVTESYRLLLAAVPSVRGRSMRCAC